MTPFEAALSNLTDAVLKATSAFSLSPTAMASRTLRIWVFSSDLTATLRRRDFSFVAMRLIWDLMFATRILEFNDEGRASRMRAHGLTAYQGGSPRASA